MIKIYNPDVYGWESAIRGMRNPKNSWERSDTVYGTYWGDIDNHKCFDSSGFCIGNNDLNLMQTLAKAGTEHAKYLRYITVTCDIVAPLYWYKEMDTYKVGVEHNSCSTMHKIQEKEFTIDDFSTDHMNETSKAMMMDVIGLLNASRNVFNETKDKEYWWQMIQLLPSSFNQRRTYQFNYQSLSNIYRQRKNHKLDEWRTFCEWIKTLPYSGLITGE